MSDIIYVYVHQLNKDCKYPKNECSMYGYLIQNIPGEQDIYIYIYIYIYTYTVYVFISM